MFITYQTNGAYYNVFFDSVRFYGCLPRGHTPDVTLCAAAATVDSTDPTAYRHFAVDDLHDVVYFCDRSPYSGRMHCYSSVRADGDNLWNG